jgi:hypothetical protein
MRKSLKEVFPANIFDAMLGNKMAIANAVA